MCSSWVCPLPWTLQEEMTAPTYRVSLRVWNIPTVLALLCVLSSLGILPWDFKRAHQSLGLGESSAFTTFPSNQF